MKLSRNTRLMAHRKPRRVTNEPAPVNPTVMRASTLAYDSVADLNAARARRTTQQTLSYGARGTSTTQALEDALTDLEGGARTQLYPTGLAAIAGVLLSTLKPGDHLLITDAAYTPARQLVNKMLGPMGIDCEFYAANGHDLASRIRADTRMVYAELPGSLLFEMTDFPKLVAAAKAVNALVVVDNTWASGWLFNPLHHGADVSILAVTKYIGGHSDLVMGAAVCNEQAYRAVGDGAALMGQTCSPDDAYLALRGLRTLGARLAVHGEQALSVARWLEQQSPVSRVHCPMLESDPGHTLWKRDFNGGNGLLTIELKDPSIPKRDTFIDALKLFVIGASWGSFESLSLPADPQASRSVDQADVSGTYVRLHVGLESVDDLLADLTQAFAAAEHVS
ncbi:MAG: cystathionine beta-lyase [Burkholderiaceae bacterium]